MTKVTYYMYSCDACCMTREMMGMNDLDSVKCQKSRKRTNGINRNVNDNKIRMNSAHLPHLKAKNVQKVQWLGFVISRERKCASSLDLRPFGPSVLDRVRSKVALCGEGYAWAPIWWSSDNSKR